MFTRISALSEEKNQNGMNATGTAKIVSLPQVDPAREKEARLMGLRVLQCITHPRFRQRINNAKKIMHQHGSICRSKEGNYFNQSRKKKRENSCSILIICHKNGLSSFFINFFYLKKNVFTSLASSRGWFTHMTFTVREGRRGNA